MKSDVIFGIGKELLEKSFPAVMIAIGVAFILLVIPLSSSTIHGEGQAYVGEATYSFNSIMNTVEERDDNIYGLRLATTDEKFKSTINFHCKADNIIVSANSASESIVNSMTYSCSSDETIEIELIGKNASILVTEFDNEKVTANKVYMVHSEELYGNYTEREAE